MLRICNLSSGSEGNCTYVEINSTKILIDAGISAARIVAGLEKLNVKPTEINAVVVSHEHYDHVKGLDVFAGKYNINVYAHKNLWGDLNKKLSRVLSLYKHVFFDQPFVIGDATIESVEVPHDALHTSAFAVSDGTNAFSIITDLGEFDDNILSIAKNSALVFIESNHDVEMIRTNQKYSYHLKARILSKKGHLSNDQCALAIEKLSQMKARQFVLAHLSKENNHPDVAYQTVCSYLATKNIIEGKHIKIDIASTQMGNIFKIV